jgi:hypothetical protein
MKTIRLLGILLITAMLFIGCPDETAQTKLPGKFAATLLSDNMGSNRNVSLGTYTVANSKSIFFILRNVGDYPITDVTLTPGKLVANGASFIPITDNGVTASPGTIAVLETSGNATIENIIEVNINHGNIAGLISQQYVQKADFAGTTIRIQGRTTDGGSDLNISLDLDIGTLIKVASFDVLYGSDKVVEYNTTNNNIGFIIPSLSQDIFIKNTGNVDIKIKNNSNYQLENASWQTLTPEDSIKLILSNSAQAYTFLVDTMGIMFDNQGIDDIVFKPGTSIIFSDLSYGYGYEFIRVFKP